MCNQTNYHNQYDHYFVVRCPGPVTIGQAEGWPTEEWYWAVQSEGQGGEGTAAVQEVRCS